MELNKDILMYLLSFIESPYDAHSLMSASSSTRSMTEEWRKREWMLGNLMLKPYQVSLAAKFGIAKIVCDPVELEISMLAMAVRERGVVLSIDNLEYWRQLCQRICILDVVEFVAEPDKWIVEHTEDRVFNGFSSDSSSEEIDEEDQYRMNETLIIDEKKVYITDKFVSDGKVITNIPKRAERLRYCNGCRIVLFNPYEYKSNIIINKRKDNRLTIIRHECADKYDKKKLRDLIDHILSETNELYIISDGNRLTLNSKYHLVDASKLKKTRVPPKNNDILFDHKTIYIHENTKYPLFIPCDNVIVIDYDNVNIEESEYARTINVFYYKLDFSYDLNKLEKEARELFSKSGIQHGRNRDLIHTYHIFCMIGLDMFQVSLRDIAILVCVPFKEKKYPMIYEWWSEGPDNKIPIEMAKKLLLNVRI